MSAHTKPYAPARTACGGRACIELLQSDLSADDLCARIGAARRNISRSMEHCMLYGVARRYKVDGTTMFGLVRPFNPAMLELLGLAPPVMTEEVPDVPILVARST